MQRIIKWPFSRVEKIKIRAHQVLLWPDTSFDAHFLKNLGDSIFWPKMVETATLQTKTMEDNVMGNRP